MTLVCVDDYMSLICVYLYIIYIYIYIKCMVYRITHGIVELQLVGVFKHVGVQSQ